MAAQYDQDLLRRFRLDADSLRDLDAVIRERIIEVDPNIEVEYEVVRRDGLRYTTKDVDDVLRERNGRDSRIIRLTVKASKSDAFDFNLEFRDELTLKLTGEDRAKVALLGAEIRSLTGDRLRVPAYPTGPRRVLISIGVGLLVFFGGVGYLSWSNALRQRNYDREYASYDRAVDEVETDSRIDLDSRLEEARSALDSGNTEIQLQALMEDRVASLEMNSRYERLDPPNFSRSPWYVYPLSITLPVAVGLAVFGLMRLAWPDSRSLFLFGDQEVEEEKRASRRDRIVWSVGVAFILGVASSIAVAWTA